MSAREIFNKRVAQSRAIGEFQFSDDVELSRGRERGLFSGTIEQLCTVLEPKLVLRSGTGLPALQFKYKVKIPPYQVGFDSCGLFTDTVKMVAYSFSLPAGPVRLGGTCSQSSSSQAIGGSEDTFICHGCYATSGNYRFRTVALTSMLRKVWVKSVLGARGGGALGLSRQLVAAIEDVYASERRSGSPNMDVNGKPFPMSRKHFRIHDSGDFAWAGPEYIHAWMLTAHALPSITFWAPTRDWHLKSFASAIRGTHIPENLVIRPSALHYGDSAPSVAGFAAGSTSCMKKDHKFKYNCPAYSSDAKNCANALGPGKACRVCWERPDVSVNYHPHSLPAVVSAAVRHREGMQSSRYRKNSPTETSTLPLPSIMLQQGYDPEDIGELQWYNLLRSTGRNDEEVASYLESCAEWQRME